MKTNRISSITRFISDMKKSFEFYSKIPGFTLACGGPTNDFTTFENEFSNYVDTNFENNSCKQKTHTYQRTFIENPKERKRQLLEDYKKKHGKMPCCNVDID